MIVVVHLPQKEKLLGLLRESLSFGFSFLQIAFIVGQNFGNLVIIGSVASDARNKH